MCPTKLGLAIKMEPVRKGKKNMKSNKKPGNWEARLRMGFLYDAAKIMTHAHHESEKIRKAADAKEEVSTGHMDINLDGLGAVHLELGCQYTKAMKEIGKKTVTRM